VIRSRSGGVAVAVAAALGVVLNLVAVFALRPVPHTYAPGDVPAWLAETLAHPTASVVSAGSFTVGLVALAAFFLGLAALVGGQRGWLVVGAAFAGLGAILNAAGTLAPIAALHVEKPVGLGLLWLTLLLDSAFNGLLGLGLIALSIGLPADWPKAHRWLGLVAGVACLPVAGQFASDSLARLLAVSAPLWCTWCIWAGALVARRSA